MFCKTVNIPLPICDPFLVDLRDKYQCNFLLSIVDSSKKRSLDDEALLVTTLKALSEAISKIDVTYHHALLNNIFTMRMEGDFGNATVLLMEWNVGISFV